MAEPDCMQTSANDIRYLANGEIDKHKWDKCLQAADCPLIYATSVYLDNMCLHWDALVMNDYQAVMPLPWNRKWGIRYLYSPYFVIGGGVFGNNLSAETVLQFLKAIPSRFQYIDLDLNELNFFPEQLSRQEILFRHRTNTLLPLQSSYGQLSAAFSTLAKRKIKKAEKIRFQLHSSASVADVIALYKFHYREKDSVIERFDFTHMIHLLTHELAGNTKAYVLRFPDGDICAFYLLLYDERFVYWLIGGSTEKGKIAGAFYYLTSLVIEEFAGTPRIFRFEGSDHPGISFFNQQFGGELVQYPRLTINRLPWPLRFVKK